MFLDATFRGKLAVAAPLSQDRCDLIEACTASSDMTNEKECEQHLPPGPHCHLAGTQACPNITQHHNALAAEAG